MGDSNMMCSVSPIVKNLLLNLCKEKYTQSRKSVSYPVIPNVCVSVTHGGSENLQQRQVLWGSSCSPAGLNK